MIGFHVGRAAGLATLLSFATFLFALSLLAIDARYHGIELRQLAPPLDRETLAAFYTLRAYYWPTAWLAVMSLVLLLILPIGLSRVLNQSPTLASAAAIPFYFGIMLGFVHVGFQSLAQTRNREAIRARLG